MKKILITGAAGQMGSTVLQTLLTGMEAENIHVLTRKPEKHEAFLAKGFASFLGDYADVASVERAMEGVDAVLLISGGDQGDGIQEHKNVVDVSVKMGVGSIAYTSRSLADRSSLVNALMERHFATEDYIKASGLRYIFFQNALYMDVLLYYVNKDAFERGRFAQVAGDGKVAFALRAEQAEAMAKVLLREDFANQTYKFTGTLASSLSDVAASLAYLTGKEMQYVPVEPAAYKEMMIANGMPAPMVDKLIDFNLDIKNGQEATVTDDLERVLGRKPATLTEGLKILFNL
jgi:NAD(P)H dehydrogenase (quinone)